MLPCYPLLGLSVFRRDVSLIPLLTPFPTLCVWDMFARLAKLEVDTPVSNLAGGVAQTLAGGVSAATKESVEVLLESIRSSKMFPKYQEMLEQMNVRIYISVT